MSPRVEIYSLCCLPIKLSFVCSIFSFIRLNLFSLMFYSPLKILHGILELSTTIINIIICKPGGSYLLLSSGVGRGRVLLGVCVNVKSRNPLPAVVSLAPN